LTKKIRPQKVKKEEGLDVSAIKLIKTDMVHARLTLTMSVYIAKDRAEKL
jgi:hypothetical protein